MCKTGVKENAYNRTWIGIGKSPERRNQDEENGDELHDVLNLQAELIKQCTRPGFIDKILRAY